MAIIGSFGVEKNSYGKSEVDEKLQRKVNRNLLDNWYFGNADSIIDQRKGYIVPSGINYYSDTGLSTLVGTTSNYLTANYVNGNYGSVTINNTVYYVAYSDMVRGYAGKVYYFDRWYGETSVSASINTGHIALITNNKAFRQKIDLHNIIYDSAYTFSVLTDSGLLYGTATIHNSLNTWATFINNADFWFAMGVMDYDTDHLQVAISTKWNPSPVNIKAVKLELGSEQTLAHQENGEWVLNEIPDYQEELRKCQREYVKMEFPNLTRVGTATSYNTQAIQVFTSLPEPLKKTPVVILNGISAFVRASFSPSSSDTTQAYFTLPSQTYTAVEATLTGTNLSFLISDTSIPTYSSGFFQMRPGSTLIIDAT